MSGIINYEQGERMIDALKHIGGPDEQVVPIPIPIKDNFKYDGHEHKIEFYNLDTSRVEIKSDSTTKAMNIGTYRVKCSLKGFGDTWEDGTTEVKIVNWSISNLDMAVTSWAKAVDADIVTLIQMKNDGEIDLHNDLGWSVGDSRTVHLSACDAKNGVDTQPEQDVQMILLHHKPAASVASLVTPVLDTNGNSTTVPSFVVGLDKPLIGRGAISTTTPGTTVSFYDSTLKNWLNGGGCFYGMLPSSLRSIFVNYYWYSAWKNLSRNTMTMARYNSRFTLPAYSNIYYPSDSNGLNKKCVTENSSITQRYTYYSTASHQPYAEEAIWTRTLNETDTSTYVYFIQRSSPAAKHDNWNKKGCITPNGVI